LQSNASNEIVVYLFFAQCNPGIDNHSQGWTTGHGQITVVSHAD